MKRQYRIKEIVHQDGTSTFIPQQKYGIFWWGWEHPIFDGCFEFKKREEAEHFLNRQEMEALREEGHRKVRTIEHPYVPAIEVGRNGKISLSMSI